MASAPENAAEYQLYIDFVESREYKKLTQGENAVFKNFDSQSAEDLHQMRDYIYQSSGMRKPECTDYSSVSISRLQIGLALARREEYRKKLEKEKSEPRHHTPTATTSRSGFVGSIKGYDASRGIRC